MIRTIPLNKLRPSPRNVRRAIDEQADLQLKADIEARGLLQNLVVTPAKKPRGSFTVEAGCRRLRALAALAGEGKLADAHEVCCLVLDGGPAAAQEAGLAENFQRLAMNPADECLAFGQLIEQGADADGIARRFGLTVRFVEGRLRLSALAPEIFDALGAGEISLDVAKAYAASADRERQAYVFQQLRGGYSGSHPDSIRRMMTQATVAATDPRARLVGEDTYVAAGGRIERDLFCDESEARWLDIALLERLAGDKMEALAAQAAAETGLAWVRPTLDSWVGSSLTAGLHRILPDTAPLTEEESARIEAAQAEIEALIADLEDEQTEDEAREQAESRVQALEQEIERITDKPPLLNEAQKAQLGTFLLLSHDGRAKLDSSFYGELPPVEREPEEGREREREPSSPAVIGTGGEPVEKPQPLSRALIDELAIQRRDILAVHVAADPGLALDLAIFLMIDREAGYSSEKSGSSLLALAPTDPVFGFKTPDAAATVARAQAAEALDRSWVSATSRAERFDAFRALPQEVRAAWLGQAVARTLEASLNLPGERRCPFHDHLGRLLGVEVARWWRPTGSNYFDRVAKSVTLAALEEVGGPPFAARYAKAKKAELSETAQRVFAGEFIGEVEVKERALSWVPEPMRFASAPAAEPIDDLPPWEEEEAFEPPNAGNQQAAAPGANEDGNEAVAAPADPFEDECESPPAIVSDDREEGEAEAGGTAPFEQIEEAA